VNVIGLRLPEDPEEVPPPLPRLERLKQKLAGFWSSVAGI
jgi:cell volume regulation protein A